MSRYIRVLDLSRQNIAKKIQISLKRLILKLSSGQVDKISQYLLNEAKTTFLV